MKKIDFWKMNGAGNDFVVLDNRDLRYDLSQAEIAALCDRHRGVGADGLLAVEPAEHGTDARMRYYNADGGEAEMCGNGARCFGAILRELRGNGEAPVSFETQAGIIGAEFVGADVRIRLSDPEDFRAERDYEIEGGSLRASFVNTGVPHVVVSVEDLEGAPVKQWGEALRYHEAFSPKGTNVNFSRVLGFGRIAIRTYERGVEDETLACGTGMAASALCYALETGAESPVSVLVRGGDTLHIGFERDGDVFRDVTLTGPADLVFHGSINLAPHPPL